MTEDELFARRPMGMRMAMVVRQWRSIIDHAITDTGLTQSSWTVLMQLDQLGDHVSVSELAEMQGIELPPLMRTLTLLEQQGYLLRTVSPYDKRIRLLTLTDEGRAVLQMLTQVIESFQTRVSDGIPAADIEKFSDTLNHIACNLRTIREEKTKPNNTMMTPEQKFARWVRVSIASFLLMFIYFIVADIWIPLTPDSTVMRVVTPISSRVSGYVSQVYVHNNSPVKKGDLLYELDPTPFQNKVDAAQLALAQAKLSNQQLDAQIVAAQANLKTAQLTARNDRVTFERYQRLSSMQNVSQADLDKVRTTWQSSEQSVNSLHASIHNLQIQRGERDDHRNVTLQQFQTALQEAQLNLGWTKIRAEADGTVSNLQLSPGLYAAAGSAVMAVVNQKTDIVADFREKSLRHTKQGTDAAVVFDALPGKVFSAQVTSSDAGILAGQEAVNGELSQPEQSTRWVRDAQRMRIHVALNEPLDKTLPTGARATVQLYNSEGPFARFFSGLQIHLVSWLHYVY